MRNFLTVCLIFSLFLVAFNTYTNTLLLIELSERERDNAARRIVLETEISNTEEQIREINERHSEAFEK